MHLGELQDLLAALYVSSAERKAWCRDPETVERRYGLDEVTRTALRGLERPALEFYASQLQEKRFAEITKLIPVTSSRHRAYLWRSFPGYAERHLPVGSKKHIADAIAFGRFLHSIKDTLPGEAFNLVQFELVPWELNFHVQEQLFTLKTSEAALHLISARRTFSLECHAKHFRGYLPSLIGRLKKAQVLESPTARIRIDSIGLFLKLPFVSWHLEWYVPWLRSSLVPPC